MESLLNDEGLEARTYLKSDKRNFDDTLIKKAVEQFRIGYVPEYVLNDYGDKHEFAGRLILPLYNQYGELVILSSRDWRENAFMKFFHESFIKTNFLYGLNLAKEHILRTQQAIVVEGEFDVQYLHFSGFNQTVGCMSGILNLGQLSILRRYCKEVFLVFDGDDAGDSSASKVLNLAKERNFDLCEFDIIPVQLPPETDPDQYIYKNSREAFVSLLKQSRENKEENIGRILKQTKTKGSKIIL